MRDGPDLELLMARSPLHGLALVGKTNFRLKHAPEKRRAYVSYLSRRLFFVAGRGS